MAAGIVLVREAGGFVEGLARGESAVESGSIVSANAQLFGTFAETLRAA